MKTSGRFLLLFTAALIVAAATLAFSQASLAAQLIPGQQEPAGAAADRMNTSSGSDPAADAGSFRPEGGREGISAGGFNLSTWVKNLSQLGGIVAGVILLDIFGSRLRNRRKKKSQFVNAATG